MNQGTRELVSIIIPTLNEEENIENLLKSIYEQSYRPIEVVIVDGDSTDRTLEIVKKFKLCFEDKDFRIKIFKEEDFGKLRSLPNARNIGILNSEGKYLLLLDADMVLLERDFVEKVVKGLMQNPEVHVIRKVLVDTPIEKTLLAEAMAWERREVLTWHCGYRRECFRERLLDPYLGLYEVVDFEIDLRRKAIKPIVVEANLGVHLPHTFKEFFKQQEWYGRTAIFFAKKRLKEVKRLYFMLSPLLPGLHFTSVIAFAVLSLFTNLGLYVMLILLATFIYRRLRFMLRIPRTYRSKTAILIVNIIDCVIRPLAWGLGLIKTVVKLLMRKNVYRGRG